jgi:integrase
MYPHSFRHAFAQRLADAADENGLSTTPPDVLCELTGQKSHATMTG